MSNVLRQGEPDVVDQSKVISRLLDKDISIVSESRENSAVFLVKKIQIQFIVLDISLLVTNDYYKLGVLGL